MMLSPATSHPIGCTVQNGGRCFIESMHLKPRNGGSAMKVKDMMHKGVDWVSPNTPITELAKLMQAHDIGCIRMGEDDKRRGMVTARDIVGKGLGSHNFDTG